MIAPILAFAAAAAAPAVPRDLPGTWDGTIGTLPVRACFMQRESGAEGAYYYRSHMRAIALVDWNEPANVLHEGGGSGEGAPRWRIQSANATSASGLWSGNGRTLPIRLTRIARAQGDESPCGTLAFHQPRLEGIRTARARATLQGVHYTRITLDPRGRFEIAFETFALDGSSEAVRRINAVLGEGLAGNPPQWFQCIQDSLGFTAFEGYFGESLQPVMISRRWMSVAHHWDGFCGGAHPDSSNTYKTFDLTTGAEFDVTDWLNDRAVERHGTRGSDDAYVTLRPALRDALLAGWRPEDPECGEGIRSTEFWNIGLGRDALNFSPSLPRVAQACGEDFEIPFAKLQSFLTPEGTRNLRALQSE